MRMKKHLLRLTAFLYTVLCAVSSMADGTYGENITWRTVGDTLFIEGTGPMMETTAYNRPWKNQTNKRVVVVGEGVTSVSASAFSDLIGLRNAILPGSLKTINSSAFYNCTALTQINLPASLDTINSSVFGKCGKLTKIILPPELKYLGNYAFSKCYDLDTLICLATTPPELGSAALSESYFSNISVPESTERAYAHAWGTEHTYNTLKFEGGHAKYQDYKWVYRDGIMDIIGQGKLRVDDDIRSRYGSVTTTLNLSEGFTAIEGMGLAGFSAISQITIPQSVDSLGGSVFDGCKSLESVTLHDNIRHIGTFLFNGCTSLKSVTFPSGITTIKQYTFKDCESLATVNFPSQVTQIERYAFQGCTSLSDITLPDGIRYIGQGAFSDCTGLQHITLPAELTKLEAISFNNCSSLTEIVIPDKVDTISYAVFDGCTALQSITLPASLRECQETFNNFCPSLQHVNYKGTVDQWSNINFNFYNSTPVCHAQSLYINGTLLTDIILSDTTRTIKNYVFGLNTAIKSLTLPASVESIGEYAFAECSELTTIRCEGTTPPVLGRDAFYRAGIKYVYIPEGTESLYAGAWGDQYTYISPISGSFGKDITWHLVDSVLTISGSGAIPDTIRKETPWFDYAKSIKTVIIEPGITAIGTYAFGYMDNLESVSLPSTIQQIHGSAFFECEKLKDITLPSGLTYLGSYAFYYCQSLTSVNIPEGITAIEPYTFYKCSNLTHVELPQHVSAIRSCAFYDCTRLADINLPAGLTEIGSQCMHQTAWYNAQPDGCLYFGTLLYAFKGKAAQDETVVIKDGTTEICASAFSGSNIQYVSIPSSVTLINDGAFSGSSLKQITVPGTVKRLGDGAFQGCTDMTEAILEDGITRIGERLFAESKYLQSVRLPSTITHIDNNTFYGTDIREINIPENVTEIDSMAFSSCLNLTRIVIPKNVRIIDHMAFYNCNNLATIIIQATTPPELYAGFENIAFDFDLQVPTESRALYEAVPEWNTLLLLSSGTITGTCGNNLTWELHKGTLTINGEGEMSQADYGWSRYQSYIKNIILDDRITSIANYAFKGCYRCDSLHLPDALQHIGINGCSNLNIKSITLPDQTISVGESAFQYCYQLQSVTFNNQLKEIGNYAFYYTKPNSITLPANLKAIGNNAFYINSDLTEITCNAVTPPGIGNNIFGYKPTIENVIVPKGTESAYAMSWGTGFKYNGLGFYGNTIGNSLQWLVSPNEQTLYITGTGNVPDYYSYSSSPWYTYRYHIHNLKISEGITRIGQNNFAHLNNLTEATIPSTVQTIGGSAFDSTPLKRLTATAGDQQLSIDKTAFTNTALDSVALHRPVSDFAFCPTAQLRHLILSALQETLPDGLLSQSAQLETLAIPFPGAGNSNNFGTFGTLFSVTSSDNMTGIIQKNELNQQTTYYIPSGLTKVTILEGCKQIPYGTFYNCAMLHEVELPATTEGVGDAAFFGCSGLTTLRVKSALPPTAYEASASASGTFTGMNMFKCNLYVPYNAKQYYSIAQGWKAFYYINEDTAPIVITVQKNIDRAGEIVGITQYNYGETASLEAIAHTGYKFICWMEADTVLSSQGKIEFTATGSRYLTAVFQSVPNTGDINVTPTSDKVSLSFAAIPEAHSYVLEIYTDEAMTQLCATIQMDADGNIVNVRSVRSLITLTVDKLTASTDYYYKVNALDEEENTIVQYSGSFSTSEATGIISAENEAIDITIRQNTIHISGYNGLILIYHLGSGNTVYKGYNSEINLPQGMYLIKCGSMARKVQIK